jgi:GH24 family phage-related lysozyme (muramidase)
MNEYITVDCTIAKDGRVWVRRIKSGDRWQAVEQGRQWGDEDGRHVLIMCPGHDVQELLLSSATLRWELVPRRSGPQIL